MAKRVANSVLNASTLDILNVIRQNAGYEYQSSVPVVTQATDIPKVGDIIYGTPAIANQFLNALVNRIALVRVQSATFNNPYKILKGGYLEFGETIEDIFVGIAQVVEYDPEKGEAREFKRTIPDVRSVFHIMNWRVLYPVTVQDEDLKRAFLSLDGVTELIAKIVDQVYTAAEYDEFLLFKYLLIKATAGGKLAPVSVGDLSDLKNASIAIRGISNKLPFMSSNYNEAGVKTNTPKDRQVIFMDSEFNAQFDVEVLASAFNMDKADFMGRLFLIDDFTTFDNDRFNVIRANSDGISEVTPEELAIMSGVKAILLDERWFQIYDNLNKFTEKMVASGLYWNYFFHTWKTVSYSPYANAVAFVSANMTYPNTITVTVTGKEVSADGIALTFADNLSSHQSATTVAPVTINFNKSPKLVYVQTQDATTKGFAIQPYGSLTVANADKAKTYTMTAVLGDQTYVAGSTIKPSTVAVGDTVTLSKV